MFWKNFYDVYSIGRTSDVKIESWKNKVSYEDLPMFISDTKPLPLSLYLDRDFQKEFKNAEPFFNEVFEKIEKHVNKEVLGLVSFSEFGNVFLYSDYLKFNMIEVFNKSLNQGPEEVTMIVDQKKEKIAKGFGISSEPYIEVKMAVGKIDLRGIIDDNYVNVDGNTIFIINSFFSYVAKVFENGKYHHGIPAGEVDTAIFINI